MKINKFILFILLQGTALLGVPGVSSKSEISKKNKVSTITVKNCITKKDLGYKKWGTHYPKKFTVKVNGKPVNSEKQITIENNGELEVEYYYEWWAPWGKITGTKVAKFKCLDNTMKQANITFNSWDKETRIKIPGAKQIGNIDTPAPKAAAVSKTKK